MIRLALHGLRHYWKLSICLFLGVFIASAILTGSLLVGDSVKETLRQASGKRIGAVKQALVTGERFVTHDLSARVSKRLPGHIISPVLFSPGVISTPDKTKRANGVRIYGVTDSFWKLAGRTPPEGSYLAVGKPLAEYLKLDLGDAVIARMEMPGRVSRDAPLSGDTEEMASLSGSITHIISSENLGSFSLLSEQTDALNIFLPLNLLQQKMHKAGRINLVLSSGAEEMQSIVDESWSLADAELALKALSGNLSALVSDRVFISEAEERAVFAAFPDSEGVISYLVNDFHKDSLRVPYSVAVGIGPRSAKRLGVSLPTADEIVINDWLAAPSLMGGLGAEIGDELGISFFAVKSAREFIVIGDGKSAEGEVDSEDLTTFRVAGIIPQGSRALADAWVPEFPGLETAQTLATWESGLPIDTKRIRDQDELFWDKYKATPKAFMSLHRAQQLWGNRFGRLSGIHLGHVVNNESSFVTELRNELKLADLGINLRELSDETQRAVEGSLDFGILFASLSGFLVLSSILLVALMCVFGMESRVAQIGLMAAIGFTRQQVRRLFLYEAGIICIMGAALGACGGVGYTKVSLWALGSVWDGASAGILFTFHARPFSVFAGAIVIFTVALVSIYFSGRHITSRCPRGILGGESFTDGALSESSRRRPIQFGVVSGVCAGAFLAWMGSGLEGEKLAGAFFGAGFLLLVAGIGVFVLFLDTQKFSQSGGRTSLLKLGFCNLLRNRGRSVAVVGMVSAGVFLVSAVNAFRLSEDDVSINRNTGTGGFQFIGTTSLPVYDDLNNMEVRDRFGLEDFSPNELKFVQMRVCRGGEEASCLNLNHPSRPRILGVDPVELSDRKAFRFAAVKETPDVGYSPWKLLESDESSGVIPVIGDKASVMWSLKKNLGESIFYPDGRGGEVELRIVALLENSILQGNLLMSEDAFKKVFPDSGGHRFFLVDVGEGLDHAKISGHVMKSLEMQGMSLESAKSRLAAYARVQNTYISIFTVLGGLGALLGTAGVGILIARNVIERRGELAVMSAIGFRRKSLVSMLLSEHFTLLFGGVLIGALSALIAIAPNVFGNAGGIPLAGIACITGLISIGGLFFCIFATGLALRGSFLEAISNE